jgi:hypothetical protein
MSFEEGNVSDRINSVNLPFGTNPPWIGTDTTDQTRIVNIRRIRADPWWSPLAHCLSLSIQIRPFPGLNKRCPVEWMPQVLSLTQYSQLRSPQSLTPSFSQLERFVI